MSNPAATRGRPTWKIALGSTAAVLLAGILFTSWVGSSGDRRWTGMAAKVRAMREERARAGPPGRILGTEPGDAWTHYGAAFAAVEPHADRAVLLEKALARSSPPDLVEVASLLEPLEEALEILRRAARCRVARGPADVPYSEVRRARPLAAAVAWKGRLLVEEGKGREAALRLIEFAQLAVDLGDRAGHVPRAFADGYLGEALGELCGIVLRGALTREDLAEVERHLLSLDGVLPDAGPLEEIDVLSLGEEYLSAEDLFAHLRAPRCMCREDQVAPWGAWRYGFSDRLMSAAAFERALSLSHRASSARGASWTEARRIRDEILAALVGDANPLMRAHVAKLMGSDGMARRRRAQVRLLRWAARFRATGEPLALEDPFGVLISHSAADGRLKAWSAGRDGVDDGGRGSWTSGDDLVLDGTYTAPRP